MIMIMTEISVIFVPLERNIPLYSFSISLRVHRVYFDILATTDSFHGARLSRGETSVMLFLCIFSRYTENR